MDTKLKRRTTRLWVVSTFILLFLLSWLNPLSAQPPRNSPALLALQDKASRDGSVRIIVQLDTSFTPEGALKSAQARQQRRGIAQAQRALLNRIPVDRIRNHREFSYTPLMAMEVTPAGLQTLMAGSGWTQIQEDKQYKLTLADSTPLVGSTSVQSQGFGGAEQTIAILDTGVDSNHPFLAGKVVAEACFSTTISAANIKTACPNGSDTQIGPGAAAPYATNIFGREHGTHVAGIAAGGNPGIAFTGVAPDATLIAIQVFSFQEGTNCGGLLCSGSFTSDLISALEHVYSLRNTYSIASVNMSLGGGLFSSACDSDLLKPAIDLLRSVEIASVISSGNDGASSQLSSPACISSAISVGSTTKADAVSSFSNSASFLDLLAPGQSIQSSVPGSGYSYFNGTSMASPHVAGAWAVMKDQIPAWTVSQVLANLKSQGVPVTDSRNGRIKPRLAIPFLAVVAFEGLMVGSHVCDDGLGGSTKQKFIDSVTVTVDLSAFPLMATRIQMTAFTAPFNLTGMALFKNQKSGVLQLFGDDGNSRELALSSNIKINKKTGVWSSLKGKFQLQDPGTPVCTLAGKFKAK